MLTLSETVLSALYILAVSILKETCEVMAIIISSFQMTNLEHKGEAVISAHKGISV